VRDGENGFFFEPGDDAGLASALLACSRREFTGLRSDALARFSLDRMVDETIGVYRELTHA
jgi:glycosyltransferase involved in cell wall biosynthesis